MFVAFYVLSHGYAFSQEQCWPWTSELEIRLVSGLAEPTELSRARQFMRTPKVWEQPSLIAALARFERTQKKDLFKSAALVAPAAEIEAGNLSSNRLPAYVEAALIYAARGDSDVAIRMLDYAADKTRALANIHVRAAKAEILAAQKNAEAALQQVESALRYGDKEFRRRPQKNSSASASEPAGGKPRTKPHPQADCWKHMRSRLLASQKRLQRLLQVERHGLAFVLYAEAQVARVANHPLSLDFTLLPGATKFPQPPKADFDHALELYAHVLELKEPGPYNDAAKLYHAVCQIKTGSVREGVASLERFVQEQPFGHYRGEALLLLGHVALESRWDFKKAEEYYNRCLKWCVDVRAAERTGKPAFDPTGPTATARAKYPPKEVAWRMKDTGVFKRVLQDPEVLFNRKESTSYLDQLEHHSYLQLGFIRFVHAEYEPAAEQFKKAWFRSPILKKGFEEGRREPLTRCILACRDRGFIGTPYENDPIKPLRLKAQLFYGDFHYQMNDTPRWEAIYAGLGAHAKKTGNQELQGRVALSLVLGLHYGGQRERSTQIGLATAKANPRSHSMPKILWVTARKTITFRGEKQKQGLALFKRSYTRYPDSPYVEQARYEEVYYSPKELWDDLYLRFKKDFPDGEYLRHLDAKIELDKWLLDDSHVEEMMRLLKE